MTTADLTFWDEEQAHTDKYKEILLFCELVCWWKEKEYFSELFTTVLSGMD